MSAQSNYSTQSEMNDEEISLRDIVNFFRSSWKLIGVTGLIGVVVGSIFLLIKPNQYEATAQIQMSQLAPKGTGQTSVSPTGVNIEEPSLLIARFQLPSTYSEYELKACGVADENNPQESLASIVKITPLKNVASVVELKMRRNSPLLAKACVEVIFEKIRETQSLIKAPFLEEAKSKIELSKKQLSSARSILERADKSGGALSASYLSTRDEVRMLQDKIMDLEDFIAAGEARKAKLISPIYSPGLIVFPKKILSLVISLLAGLFFGILMALLKKTWNQYQA